MHKFKWRSDGDCINGLSEAEFSFRKKHIKVLLREPSPSQPGAIYYIKYELGRVAIEYFLFSDICSQTLECSEQIYIEVSKISQVYLYPDCIERFEAENDDYARLRYEAL